MSFKILPKKAKIQIIFLKIERGQGFSGIDGQHWACVVRNVTGLSPSLPNSIKYYCLPRTISFYSLFCLVVLLIGK